LKKSIKFAVKMSKNSSNIFFLFLSFFCAIQSHAQTIDWTVKANPIFNSINSVVFRADGEKILSGTNCHPASIRIFDVNTANLEWDYTVGEDFMCIMGVSFSANTDYIAAIEEFGNIFIFDNTGLTPTIIDTIVTGTSYGFSVVISPSNEEVTVACSNGKMKIYEIASGELLEDIDAHPSWVTTVAYSPDGSKLVTGGNDDKVKIWSNDGSLLHTCSGHSSDITNVKVSPDNLYVVSSSKDNTIKIWDLTTGIEIKTITGHTGDVNSVDLSPDGSKIVSASADSTCKIWNFTTGNLITTFGVLDSGAVNTVAWSPNGDKIITGNSKSDLVLWNIPLSLKLTEIIEQNQVLIFPNPANTFLEIQILSELGIGNLKIYNEIGQTVKILSDFKSDKIDLSDLSEGVYFVEFTTNQTSNLTKLIIQH
jgi:WD40 repeat protein